MQSDAVLFEFTGPFGVPVQIGQSMGFLIALIVYFNISGGIIGALIFAALLIGAIFLHELGHAWAAKVQGIPVRRIMLHGGGGFCEHGRTSSYKQDEFIVAMGPLTNLALWALAGIGLWAMYDYFASGAAGFLMPNSPYWSIMGYLSLFATINIMLFAFNLLPVQPLDGGKLTHLFLLRLMPPGTAQRVTGGIGLVASLLWIPAAFYIFVTFGFILFFFPSIRLHYQMMKGGLGV